MNFNYNKNLANFNLERGLIKNNEQENLKDKKDVPEQSAKSSLIEPKLERVTENADKILTNYIKASIKIEKTSTPQNNLQLNVTELPSEGGGEGAAVTTSVEDLILQWEQNSNAMADEDKIELLNSIIEALENDDRDADVWRLRRYIIIHNKNMNDLFLYSCGSISQRPGRPYVPGDNYYDKLSGDTDVYLKYSHIYYHEGGIQDDDMRALFFEAQLARNARWLEANLIDLSEDPENPNYLALAKTDAQQTFTAFVHYAENTEWGSLDGFTDLKNEFMTFRNSINQYQNGGLDEEAIASLRDSLTEKIQVLTDNGLPTMYCTMLTLCVESYLASVGLRHLWP